MADRDGPVGICVSGGGVRAAAFGLGALQALQDEKGLVYGDAHADYISAVSGGSYTVGAITMLVAKYDGDPDFAGNPDPFAVNSPEVEFVRRHARFLMGKGALETVLQFVLRAALNLAFLAGIVFLATRPLGWVYGAGLDQLADADRATSAEFDVGPIRWLTGPAVAALAIGLVAVVLSVFARGHRTFRVTRAARRILLPLGIALFVLGVVIPEWLGWLADRWVTERDITESGAPAASIPWAAGSSIATIVAAIVSLKAVVPEGVGRSIFSRRARPLLTRAVRMVAAVVALVSVPLAVVSFGSAMALAGALNVPWDTATRARGEVLLYLAVSAVFLFLLVFGDAVNWSLHPFYKRRLMSCFCVVRDVRSPLGVRERPYSPRYALSRSRSDKLPSVLICAAANVSGFGNSPAGQDVLPFVFSAERIGFTNRDGLWVDTAKLENALARAPAQRSLRDGWDLLRRPGKGNARNVTLPAAVAITGAAFSPSMGKMTIAPVRALMAVLNLRLGVWLPNPAHERVRAACEGGTALRSRPAPWYIICEALGLNSPTQRFVYVSDGGHYENLGLVELLRRNVTTIWCIDGSGDRPGRTSTLTEAMLVAEAELGVQWTDISQLEQFALDEEATEARGHLATIRSTHACLSYALPNGGDGTLHVVKLGVMPSTPEHLLDYQRRKPSFPYDSTGNQLFRADRFDAYRSLGYASAAAAFEEPEEPAPPGDGQASGDALAAAAPAAS
jgi:hypothetical protein